MASVCVLASHVLGLMVGTSTTFSTVMYCVCGGSRCKPLSVTLPLPLPFTEAAKVPWKFSVVLGWVGWIGSSGISGTDLLASTLFGCLLLLLSETGWDCWVQGSVTCQGSTLASEGKGATTGRSASMARRNTKSCASGRFLFCRPRNVHPSLEEALSQAT